MYQFTVSCTVSVCIRFETPLQYMYTFINFQYIIKLSTGQVLEKQGYEWLCTTYLPTSCSTVSIHSKFPSTIWGCHIQYFGPY